MPHSLPDWSVQPAGSSSAPCAPCPRTGRARSLRTGLAALFLAAAAASAEPGPPSAESAVPVASPSSTLAGAEPVAVVFADAAITPRSPVAASGSASPLAVVPGPLDAPPEPSPPPPVPGPDSDAGEGPSPGSASNGSSGEAAGADSRALAPPWRLRFWAQTFRDAGSIAVSPTRWDGRDYALATAVLGGTAGLMLADGDIRDRVVRDCDPRDCRESRWVKWAGDGWVTIPALGVLYGVGASRGNERLSRTSLASFESFLVANLYSQTIKRAFNRERPVSTDDPWSWKGPTLSGVNLAFPSGHAVAAWSVFSVWALEYDETVWVPVAAYALAGAVSASRVWDNRHWASDAFFGSALGFFVARSIVRRHPPSAEGESSGAARARASVASGTGAAPSFAARPRAASVSWAPWIHEGSPGLALVVSLP